MRVPVYFHKFVCCASLACLADMLAAPDLWAAPASFPRGTGLYYDPFKFAVCVASFLGWVKLCAWLDIDARHYRIDPVFWNGMVLLAGSLGFLFLWALGNFWTSWILFWALVCGATYWYLTVRNKKADEEDQLFNQEFFMRLFNKHMTKSENGKKDAKVVNKKKESGAPVRFLSRTIAGEVVDAERVDKVQSSKGYKAAVDLVWDAVQKRATDIHLEPSVSEMACRFRIDGMMTLVKPFDRMTGDGIINVFKVVSNMDITERRKPQDGSFSAQVKEHVVEFRVATAGSVAGEKMVMRILDTSTQLADLNQVGMPDSLQAQVRDLISKPNGLFLVCGPTGSGKTTTLYACLHEIDRFQQNIITVENPVEYRLDNVTQIEVNPKAGKTFAGELRSILRQDPDVILVGEIRDKETAEIACQAAQTGHLVFSTVHANDSVTAIARMIDLGVPPFMLSSALMGVLAQRLVRKLCKKCRKRVKPNADTLKKLKADADMVRYLYRAFDPVEDAKKNDDEDSEDEKTPEVCEACGGTSYLRRTGIFELLILNERVRELIQGSPNVQEIRRAAADSGLRTLFEDGARLVIEGDTSIQELLRVSK